MYLSTDRQPTQGFPFLSLARVAAHSPQRAAILLRLQEIWQRRYAATRRIRNPEVRAHVRRHIAEQWAALSAQAGAS